VSRRLLVAAAAAGALLLAGCGDVVNGTGNTAVGGGSAAGPSSGRDFPSASPSGSNRSGGTNGSGGSGGSSGSNPSGSASGSPIPPTGSGAAALPSPCPHVSYPGAHLSFTCITTGLTAHYQGPVWPVSEAKTVEPASGWVLEEGAGHWGPAAGHSLATITRTVRQQMIDTDGYGDRPTVTTVADKDTTVDGAKAHLLQSTITLNAAWATQNRTKVRQEKLWIIAVQVAPDDVSLWYASIPDLARSLWPRVPSIIDTIKVG
jgi:hypothetical protein